MRQADTAFRRRKEHQHLYFGPEQQFVLSSGSDGLRGTVYSAHCGGRGGCPHLSGYQSGGLQPSFRILLLRCGCVARFHPLLQRHSGRRRLRNEPALCDDRHIYRHQACTSRADHASFVQLLPARQGQHSCRLCERSVQRICLARIPDGRIYTFNRTSGAGKSSASARLRRQIKTAQSAPGRAARHAPADFLCINLP